MKYIKENLFKLFIIILFAPFIFMKAAPSVPTGVKGISYEQHVDVVWDNPEDTTIAGYRIYKWNGSNYALYAQVNADRHWYTEWTGAVNVSASYKVRAYDIYGSTSPLSDSVNTLTKAMSHDEFLDMVQRATFRYFYDFGHPVSGLARERDNSGNTVTTGGSGFGIMALITGVERGFITRQQGAARMLKILNFLTNKAQRYHGVFPHWLNGETGETIPFSTYDNGGDLVETAFMIEGLLTARGYFNGSWENETTLRSLITAIWEGVEWTWYRKDANSQYLYWHWSPNYGWQINMRITGWDEAMMCYLLGIASPTYKIPTSMYYNGWASSGYTNGGTFYGYKLWVGQNYGGPLFFAHYSFLGFDPRNKKDRYTNYFDNNRNHTLINREYCIDNPHGYEGYNENSWGLTASDDPDGYSAHAPFSNDNGTITPSAALSSMPYTPEESIAALKYFYRTYGSNLWGNYGFKDAFNLHRNWFASSYLAIDQGPIIAMIENYRSQVLWNNFMADEGIKAMVDSIFVPDSVTSVNEDIINKMDFHLYNNYPNPFNSTTTIRYFLPSSASVTVEIYNSLGERIRTLFNGEAREGENRITWNGLNDYGKETGSGVYFCVVKSSGSFYVNKMVMLK